MHFRHFINKFRFLSNKIL